MMNECVLDWANDLDMESRPSSNVNNIKEYITVPAFHLLATVAAVICFVLAATWLLAPQVLFAMLGLEYSYPAGLVSRRSAALFAGVGVMLFLERHAAPSPSRNALSIGFVVACLVLAGLGIFEFIRKRANSAILLAVTVEVVLAAAFIAWALR